MNQAPESAPRWVNSLIGFCLRNKLVVGLLAVLAVGYGLMVAPFDWHLGGLPRDPVPVDAIPDLGENQQIVFTNWPGRSPQDIEDQVTYPLTVALLGLPQVKTIRSYSYFGFSTIYVVFEERADFYDSRSRILEKLGSLSPGTLPDGVLPSLGPDATALGQVFWYTLEGRDPQGEPTGGWDLDELRSIQDWYVRYSLASAEGVSEVASVGGFVREYQVDVDPGALLRYGIGIDEVARAVSQANLDVGARTIEINRVEYVVRGVGFLKSPEDLAASVVAVRGDVPVTVGDVAAVGLGPAGRRGALDKEGAEAVGGVVVVRFGENPLAAIKNVKAKIAEISGGLPRRTLPDGTQSQVTIVPFYDRTGLIRETLGTLRSALGQQILVTVIVVIVLVMNLRGSLLVAGLLPVAVLMSFIGMKGFGVDANIVALSGIAIAIGTMVDMGVILVENIMRRLDEADPQADRGAVIFTAAAEVGGAVVTAVLTTIISFLPVFTMEAAEGKLFKPLAYTKTFALLASIVVALVLIPPAAHLLFGRRRRIDPLVRPGFLGRIGPRALNFAVVILVGLVLAGQWQPLGPQRGLPLNFLFTALLLGLLLLAFFLFVRIYPRILRWCLGHKALFLTVPAGLIALGLWIWPNLGKEFMPPLDEGSFLFMPTTMPHASIGEALDVLQKLDRAIASIPEVDQVVGKLGRADSPLDPAPISMVETVINYKPEFSTDESGRLHRNWRPEIRSADDIWREIVRATKLPGTTSAPKLQPIGARLVMLQSGMRAPMGVKVKGPDLETIEAVGLQIERYLKEVPEVEPAAVVADRIVGKPYLEIAIDRLAIARYGLTIAKVQDVIETAVGGRPVTMTVEGRERYPVRVRYARELRDDPEDLGRILVPAPTGAQIPLGQLATIDYVRGPQAIKSEDTFLVGYVLFDMKPGQAEVDVVEAARAHLQDRIDAGDFVLPAGVSYTFAGSYENQVRSEKRLAVVLPLALLLIFLILYLQFRSVLTTGMVFSGIFVAWAGGFLMIWLYGQPWFLDVSLLGVNLRDLFQVHPINLSVAIWVGFIALFGIASDDGVVMATYLDQTFARGRPRDRERIRALVIEGAGRRIRPAMMTTATTILALLPVLTSTGRGSDIMVPMAIPSFGGMVIAMLTVLVVPVLYSLRMELAAGRDVREP